MDDNNNADVLWLLREFLHALLYWAGRWGTLLHPLCTIKFLVARWPGDTR